MSEVVNEKEVTEKFKCIPIRLKVEVGDFYYNLIEPLRDDKELTTFITNALRGYFEDDDVRDAIDRYNAKNDPMYRMQEQINSIMMTHQKSMAMLHNTQMVVDSATEIMEEKADESNNLRSLVAEEVKKALEMIGVTKAQLTSAENKEEETNVNNEYKKPLEVVEHKVVKQEKVVKDEATILEEILEETENRRVAQSKHEESKDVSYNESNDKGEEKGVNTTENAKGMNDDKSSAVADVADEFELTFVDDEEDDNSSEEKSSGGASNALSKLRKLKASTSHS